MSKSEHNSIQPKSIRQKQILDIAAENPRASLNEIAEQVPSATADHVDRVLNQYGDPAGGNEEPAGESEAEDRDDAPSSNSMANSNSQDEGTAAADQTEKPAVTDQNGGTAATEQNDAPVATEQSDAPAAPGEGDGSEAPEHTEQSDATAATKSAVETEPAGSVADGEAETSTSAEAETTDADEVGPTTADEASPDPDDLTQKERETLRAICYEPNATQKQIAEMLNVSRATVSNRVNAIRGFDWADRQTFVDDVFDDDLVVDSRDETAPATTETSPQDLGKQALTDGASETVSGESSGVPNPEANPETAGADTGVTDSSANASPAKSHDASDTETVSSDEPKPVSREIERVSERLATIEREVTTEDASGDGNPFDDAGLVHKVVYACMNSERVSEDEEFQILEGLMN